MLTQDIHAYILMAIELDMYFHNNRKIFVKRNSDRWFINNNNNKNCLKNAIVERCSAVQKQKLTL